MFVWGNQKNQTLDFPFPEAHFERVPLPFPQWPCFLMLSVFECPENPQLIFHAADLYARHGFLEKGVFRFLLGHK